MYKIYPAVKTYEALKNDGYLVRDRIKVYNPMSIYGHAYLTAKLAEFIEVEEINDEKDADLKYVKSAELPGEGYHLHINNQGVTIRYADYNGMLYATGTLCQILSQMKDGKLEALEISDAPMITIRGFFLDISRNKVPTLALVKQVLDLMELVKMNHFELYVEGFTLELDSFKQYLTEEGYITKEEYAEIESYANVRGIDFVPNHNSFGHMAPYLKQPEFHDLSVLSEGTDAWDVHFDCRTLNPLDPGSIELLRRIYKDLLPMSSSKLFHMGFDEPLELGKGKSAEVVKEEGFGKVYADFLLKACDEVRKHGKTPIIFTDILHDYPEVYDMLPKDAYYCDWGYEAAYKFDFYLRRLSKIGGKLIASPGTSNWNTVVGRSRNALFNIDNAIDAVLNNSGEGVILTEWGDCGNLQFLPASLMLLAYTGLRTWRKLEGAQADWWKVRGNYFDMIDFANAYIWKDKEGLFAQTILDLADYNRYLPYFLNNTSIVVTYRRAVIDGAKYETESEMILSFMKNAEPYFMSEKAYVFLDGFLNLKEKEIDMASLGCEDGELVKAEFKQSIAEIRAAMKLDASFHKDVDPRVRIRYLTEALEIAENIAEDHKALWLQRAKIGGYEKTEKELKSFERFIAAALRYFQGEMNTAPK